MPANTTNLVRTTPRIAALALPALLLGTLTITACDQQDTPSDPFDDAPADAQDDDASTPAASQNDDDVQADGPQTGDQFCWGYNYTSSQSRAEVESCSAAADDYIDMNPDWLEELEMFGAGEAAASCQWNGATDGDGELPDGGDGPMGAAPGGWPGGPSGPFAQQIPKCALVCASHGKVWNYNKPRYGTCALNLKAAQIDEPEKVPSSAPGAVCAANQTRWRRGATVQFDCGCVCD